MSPSYWKEWASWKLNELQRYTAYLDIYNTYVNSQDLLADLVVKYKTLLMDKGYPARACDVWCYIFVVNDIFNFKYSSDELCKYVDVHLSNTGLKESKSFDSILSFERFLTVNVINKKINMTVLDYRDEIEWADRPCLMFNMLFQMSLILLQNIVEVLVYQHLHKPVHHQIQLILIKINQLHLL